MIHSVAAGTRDLDAYLVCTRRATPTTHCTLHVLTTCVRTLLYSTLLYSTLLHPTLPTYQALEAQALAHTRPGGGTGGKGGKGGRFFALSVSALAARARQGEMHDVVPTM